jgi:hypothetical protein
MWSARRRKPILLENRQIGPILAGGSAHFRTFHARPWRFQPVACGTIQNLTLALLPRSVANEHSQSRVQKAKCLIDVQARSDVTRLPRTLETTHEALP